MAPPQSPTTDTTVADALGGDDVAFTRLHRRHAPAVIASAQRVLRNAELATDVAQEVFLDLWRRPERFDASRGTIEAMLVTQARSRAIDRLRSDQSRRAREDRVALDPSQRPVLATDAIDRDALREAISELDVRQRAPIELAYYHGYSYREVAVRLEASEGTVKSRIRAGLKNLRVNLAVVAAA